ncbi:M56 family metallopeptidase [Phenylobacterium sp.]|jgi:beta-lactamase regulating signal transducer with metallopeptidase domain|uniref:M56 family metallopeptidase n=1 Tax=Phenylobacterium sp. TaxID=1871053 RepID=UPI002F40A38A
MIHFTIAGLLVDLAKANIAAAVPILCVIGVRRWARGRLGARATYALWLAPLLAAGAVLLPHSAARTTLPMTVAPIVLQAETAADVFVAEAVTVTPDRGPNVPALLLAAWIAGGLCAAGLLARRQARFVASLGRLTPLPQPGLFRAERAGVGPAVVGVLRPKVVAPADFETRFAADERALILAHEAAHLRAHDAAINALACLFRCACWFNPLVHLAARLMRVDQELACDAAVVGRFPERRRAYAELLLKTQLFTQPLPLGCHWPAGAEHPLKERIAMLKSPLPARGARRLGAAVTLLACAGAAGLAWAASPPVTADGRRVESLTTIGPAERQAAQAQDNLHPNYTCDRAIELSGGGCKIIRQSVHLALPTHGDLMRLYPAAALKAGITAEVDITCNLTIQGLYRDCAAGETVVRAPDGVAVTDETRAAFGQAAVALGGYYQVRMREPVRTPFKGHAAARIVFAPDAVPGTPPPPGAIFARPPPPLPGAAAPAPAPPARVSQASPARKLLAAFAPPAAETGFVTAPDWAAKPKGEDVARVYPKANQDRMGGSAAIDCRFAGDGRLTACKVASETPPGDGFGAAALALAPLFQAKPLSKSGEAVAGRAIRIPIRFLPAAPAAQVGLVTRPDWIDKPTGADIARFYPAEALKGNWEGFVTLSCDVGKDGRLAGCSAKDELAPGFGRPADLGEQFRNASLQLASLFRMRPQTVNGVPTADGRINIPIRFALPSDPEAVARLNALRDPGPAGR